MNADRIKALEGQIAVLKEEDKAEQRRLRDEARKRENAENERKRAELLEKYGLTDKPYAGVLMSFAYEHGHSSGWSDVETWLCEAVELLDRVSAASTPKDDDDRFYILDTRSSVGNCALWWGPNHGGYVCSIGEAGIYTRAEAVAQERARDTDQAWPAYLVEPLALRHVRVDTEEFRRASAERIRLLNIDLKDKRPPRTSRKKP
jgi:hypothetical protein